MGYAKFSVSEDLLKDALALPGKFNIRNISPHGTQPDVFVFLVEFNEFPDVKEGDIAPDIHITFSADYEKKPSTWLTCNWEMAE